MHLMKKDDDGVVDDVNDDDVRLHLVHVLWWCVENGRRWVMCKTSIFGGDDDDDDVGSNAFGDAVHGFDEKEEK